MAAESTLFIMKYTPLYEACKFVLCELVLKWVTDVGLAARFWKLSGRLRISDKVTGKILLLQKFLLIITSILSERFQTSVSVL
jgi:hypothetical protein